MDPLLLLAIGTLVVVGSILFLRLHAFLALFLGALVVAALTPAEASVGARLADGFGGTTGRIGLLIALASIIGKALLDSGAADRIVRSTLNLLGERQAPLSFSLSGFFLGIPVFFDTVFYLLLPLAKAMGTRRERNYLLYVLAIVAGGAMAHSVVPPTPGPLFVASELNVNIGTMILGGLLVGSVGSLAGFGYAVWANRRWPIPLRETADISLTELQALVAKEDRELPPFWLAILPILLPVVLIAGNTVFSLVLEVADPEGLAYLVAAAAAPLFGELGNPNIALLSGAAIAIGMLLVQRRGDTKQLATAMQAALVSAGVIILITGAGGMFGDALRQSGVGERIQELSERYQLAVLPLAFVVTTFIRTAQGSATVAMITAAGIMQGFVTDPTALGFHPVYLALAIGCGSKPFNWMNDSGFWVICRMSGFTEAETLKTSSVMMAIMGLAGMAAVMALAAAFPMPLETPPELLFETPGE